MTRPRGVPKQPVVLNREEVWRILAAVSGVHKCAHVHTLRHNYATLLLEAGVNLPLFRSTSGIPVPEPRRSIRTSHRLTFTLPKQLCAVARSHQKQVYAALLREAAASLQTLAKERHWVGGTRWPCSSRDSSSTSSHAASPRSAPMAS